MVIIIRTIGFIIIFIIEFAFVLFLVKCSYKVSDFKGIGNLRITCMILILFFAVVFLFIQRMLLFYLQLILFIISSYLLSYRTNPVNYVIKFKNIKLKYFNQKDIRWANKSYGDYNLAICGCVPTAIAIAMSSIFKDITPDSVANWINDNAGVYIKPKITLIDCIMKYAVDNNIEVVCVSINEENKNKDLIENGFVFFGLLPNMYFYGGILEKFSTNDHMVLIFGIDESYFYIVDPNIYLNGINKISKKHAKPFFERNMLIGIKIKKYCMLVIEKDGDIIIERIIYMKGCRLK